MRKSLKRIGLSILTAAALCISPFGIRAGSISAMAANRSAVIRGAVINVRSGAGTDSSKVGMLSSGTAVTVTGEARGTDGNIWYSVSYTGGSGYVRSDFVRFNTSYTTDAAFEQYMNEQGFPESYKPGLRQLHGEYPSWVFRGFKTGLDWNAALNGEMEGTNSLIDKNSISSWKSIESGKFDWSSSTWPGFDGATWVGASREITAYYMDPRNFLDDRYVFQFAIHSYNPSTQNIDGLRAMLRGSFMDSGESSGGNISFTDVSTDSHVESGSQAESFMGYEGPLDMSGSEAAVTQVTETAAPPVQEGSKVVSVGEGPGAGLSLGGSSASSSGSSGISLSGASSYADIIMEAAEKTQQNPYVLAAMILQEQGKGTSGSISGASGYYNYFNVGAYAQNGMSAIERGIWYASQNGSYGRPWNTVEKSIVGGAQFFAENYLKAGQNTMYLKKFNVQGSNMFKHQYMTNVQGAAEEGAKLASGYTAEMKTLPQEFSIPIYENMPEAPSPIPTGDGNPNNKLRSLSVDGFTMTPGFSMNTEQYTLVVDPSVESVNILAAAAESHAKVYGAGSIALNNASTDVTISVTAQNGSNRQYRILINKQNGGQSKGNSTVYQGSTASYSDSSGPGAAGTESSYNPDSAQGASVIDIGNSPVG